MNTVHELAMACVLRAHSTVPLYRRIRSRSHRTRYSTYSSTYSRQVHMPPRAASAAFCPPPPLAFVHVLSCVPVHHTGIRPPAGIPPRDLTCIVPYSAPPNSREHATGGMMTVNLEDHDRAEGEQLADPARSPVRAATTRRTTMAAAFPRDVARSCPDP